jgi:hypothetical protein
MAEPTLPKLGIQGVATIGISMVSVLSDILV